MNETNILLDIYSELTNDIEHLKTSKIRKNAIKAKINALNNNYFDVKCKEWLFEQYLGKYREKEEKEEKEDIDTYNDLMKNLEILKGIIEGKIKNSCNHDWVRDDIDITPDVSQTIYYCSKCELTRK
jgi:hypothetical protein